MVVNKDADPELGAFLEQFRTGGLSGYVLAAAWPGLMFLFFGVANIALGELVILSSIFTIIGVLVSIYVITQLFGRRYIIFYEQGIVIERNGIRRSGQYTEMKIWQCLTRMSIYSVPSGGTYFYTIEFPNAKRIIVTKRQIGERLQSMIVQHQLPKIIDDYNRGRDVKLHPIYINQAGITINLTRYLWPSLNKSFAWSDIRSIRLYNGLLSIERTGRSFGAVEIPLQAIPNVYVILNLLQKLGYLVI